jgi:short-chain fatty acids transporter
MQTDLRISTKMSASERVANWYSRYFPDALIFALILTMLSVVLALAMTDSGPVGVLEAWFGGVPMLFQFAFQLAFTYAAALVLVDTPAVQRGIRRAASLIKTPQMAYLATGLIGAATSFIGWYIGPVVTAILARALAKEIRGIDYRLISAIAYSSFVISLTGISGTIPLFVATEGPLTELFGGLVPLERTTFSTMNLVSAVLIVVVTALIYAVVARRKTEIVSFHDLAIDGYAEDAAPADAEEHRDSTLADKINHTRGVLLVVGLMGLGYLVYYLATTGLAGLNLNTVAVIALVMGMLVQKDAMSYARSFTRNLSASSSIMLQFPLYGGIAAIFSETGLAARFSDGLIAIANEATFLPIVFVVTGFLNLFVPSAGSQFVATAPFFVPAGDALGVDNVMTAMAITYGDIWTNLIQPFWALLYFPILAAGTRLRVRDFMGYNLPILAAVGVIWMTALVVFGTP